MGANGTGAGDMPEREPESERKPESGGARTRRQDGRDEEWLERFHEEGEILSRWEYDSMLRDVNFVIRFEGLFYLWTDNGELYGPFRDVEEVFRIDRMNYPNGADCEIECEEALPKGRAFWKAVFNTAGVVGRSVMVDGRRCVRVEGNRLLGEPEAAGEPWETLFEAEPGEAIETGEGFGLRESEKITSGPGTLF